MRKLIKWSEHLHVCASAPGICCLWKGGLVFYEVSIGLCFPLRIPNTTIHSLVLWYDQTHCYFVASSSLDLNSTSFPADAQSFSVLSETLLLQETVLRALGETQLIETTRCGY